MFPPLLTEAFPVSYAVLMLENGADAPVKGMQGWYLVIPLSKFVAFISLKRDLQLFELGKIRCCWHKACRLREVGPTYEHTIKRSTKAQ